MTKQIFMKPKSYKQEKNTQNGTYQSRNKLKGRKEPYKNIEVFHVNLFQMNCYLQEMLITKMKRFDPSY